MARWVLLLASVTLIAADEQADPRYLLAKIRARAVSRVERLPNYTCTQTIDRIQYELPRNATKMACAELKTLSAKRRALSTSDRLRLDVGVGQHDEMYSWVGEKQFNERGLMEVVRNGPISSGAFAMFLDEIFNTNAATIAFSGKTTHNRRAALEYRFHVPRLLSHYRVRGPGTDWTNVAHDGYFRADAETLEVVHLFLRTLPEADQPGACENNTTLEYAPAVLNGTRFLLPSSSVMRVIHANGILTENRTRFSGCHEFRGESAIRFDGDEPAAAVQSESAPASIPPGIRFRVMLTEHIDVTSSAAGDLVAAAIPHDIANRDGAVIVRKGAPVHCRIMHIQRFYKPRPSFTLLLKVESITVAGKQVPVTVEIEPRNAAGLREILAPGLIAVHTNRESRLPSSNAATLEYGAVQGTMAVMPGFELTWITVAPR